MVRNPVDVASRVSPKLSELIEGRINDPDAKQPVTLGAVRIFVAGLHPAVFREAERLHRADVDESILDELDALIEEFGRSALAGDFAQPMASEPLSRVIEAVMNDDSRDNPPTFATVREAIISGLPSSLIGEGALEDDESETLQAEIDALIERFGDDSLAEKFLRYE